MGVFRRGREVRTRRSAAAQNNKTQTGTAAISTVSRSSRSPRRWSVLYEVWCRWPRHRDSQAIRSTRARRHKQKRERYSSPNRSEELHGHAQSRLIPNQSPFDGKPVTLFIFFPVAK